MNRTKWKIGLCIFNTLSHALDKSRYIQKQLFFEMVHYSRILEENVANMINQKLKCYLVTTLLKKGGNCDSYRKTTIFIEMDY